MADEQVVGMHYFDHQFLRTGDFDTAQTYHVDRLRQHNRLLHQAGIIDGLTVTRLATFPRRVRVAPGRALDQAHREVVLRRKTDPDDPQVRILLRVETADGTLETEVDMTETTLPIELDRVPPSSAADNPVFLTIRQGIKETTPIVDPGITGNTRFVERAVIEASTAPLSGAQLLLAQINRNPDGTVGNLVFTNRQRATALLANNAVTSAKIDEADGETGQDTNMGAGIKTGHIQRGAVTGEKIAENAIRAINLEPGFLNSLGGGPRWVRLPFLPKQLGENPRFNLGPTHSDCGTGGARGIMEIPVPAGATQIRRLRITGTENKGSITIRLRLAKIDSGGIRDILLTHIINHEPFNELRTVPDENRSLDAQLEGLALQVEATARSDIWFIAAEFT
jgi:hypothetical protein